MRGGGGFEYIVLDSEGPWSQKHRCLWHSILYWIATRICPRPSAIFNIHVALGNIIVKYGISFHCYADDNQLYISTRPDETSKLSKLTVC